MMYKVSCLLYTFFIVVISFSQPAVPDNGINIRSLTVNNGLPQGQVRGMVQDKEGFIWLATDGLSRYDGRDFLNYRQVVGNPASLASNDIRDLQIDDEDNLWIFYGSREVDVMNAFTGHVRHISAESAFRWLKDEAQNEIAIRQVLGRYFVPKGDSLIIFDPVTGSREYVQLPPDEILLALGGNIKDRIMLSTTKALYELKGNHLNRLHTFPAVSDSVYNYWNSLKGHGQHLVGQILRDKKGNLVITAVGGIYIYNNQKNQCRYIGYPSILTLPVPVVAANNNIYVTIDFCIYRVTDSLGVSLAFENPGKVGFEGLLLADRSGMLWTTVAAAGIRMFDLQQANFRSFSYRYSFGQDVLEPWLPNPVKGSTLSSYELRSAKDKENNIWVRSPATFDGQGKRIILPSIFKIGSGHIVQTLYRDTVYYPCFITFDDRNECWMLSIYIKKRQLTIGSLNLINGIYTPVCSPPPINTENGFLVAVAGKIAYITENQIWFYDTATKHSSVLSNAQLGIAGTLLMAIPDAREKQVLWIATKGSGMLKLNMSTGKARHFTTANGLPDNTVYYIAPDKRGFFWCSSNKGIFRFNPDNGTATSFTVNDGLQGNEFNRYHFLETPDGHFIFGGTEGYTVFHPDSILVDDFQTPVIISDLQVNNKLLQQLSSIWKDTIVSSLNQLTFTYDQNFLSFSFSGLQYNAPEKLQYRYMLEGIDKDWVIAGRDATARYTFIPAGHYRFKVNASNTAGVWSRHIKTMEITVLPPWWKTTWAYALYLVTLTGISYALYTNWLHRLRSKQQIVLKQKEAEQAHALEETKSRFFSNITHELRTPLTLIISPVQKQLQENGATYSPALLKSVYQNSRQLLRLINQLLDMSKLEAGNMPVTVHRGDITLFIEGLLHPFKHEAALKNIGFSYEHPGVQEEYLFDSDKLEKILHNLLSNAIKFTPNGNISVVLFLRQVSAGRHLAEIKIADTGIGIMADHLPHIFDRFYQANTSTTRRYEGTGIGLSLVKELADLIGGEIKAESSPGRGSLFTLILPLQVAEQNSAIPLVEYPVNDEIDVKETETNEAPVNETGKPTILVTEDNDQLRTFIKEALSPLYQVITTTDGEAGFQIALNDLPELIISDVMMPVMDGYEFCGKVKENPLTSHIGFIMLTAKTAVESRMEGLRLGADQYISKPFVVEELLLVISNLLKRQQKLRDFYCRQLEPGQKMPVVNEIHDSFLRSVYTILEKHLDNPALDVEFLSGQLAVNRRTLNRKLSSIANMSASEIIRNYRLKKSAELLLRGYNVSEAAYTTGFSTPSWFTQCFKEMYGITPVKYIEDNTSPKKV